ncbi:NADPH:quinone reductase [Cyclobacterium lianum]|uniref:NADPH:quinone reductase n=1 Tax=Cyclobacterium lianum TaxID=388280 RepID=A0A1M7Q874_9BACT|nr:zinc-binding dehydrogenase [Cyclobacterium lianum]SHN26827.1 NADPH:quinone reductase [Cyclobacterium lianum]
MKCIILDSHNSDGIALVEMKEPVPGPGEMKIKVKAAALNHRDQWCRQGKYPNLKDGIILGSDGCGTVSEVGEDVERHWLGKEVLINPGNDWGDDPAAQSGKFTILGMPHHGTFAEYICVKADRVHEKPAHLDANQGAALPLAGLTAFRALTRQGKLKRGDKVLVTGFGGGVAQFASQFALRSGAVVSVSSGEQWKLDKALEMGVAAGYNYRSDWVGQAKAEMGGFDLIVDSAMGDTLNGLIDLANPGGRIVVYGATLGNPKQIDARKIFWKQLAIQGSTMGSDSDFEEMLKWVSRHKISPQVDEVFPMNSAVAAFDKMKNSKQLGKLVLKIY